MNETQFVRDINGLGARVTNVETAQKVCAAEKSVEITNMKSNIVEIKQNMNSIFRAIDELKKNSYKVLGGVAVIVVVVQIIGILAGLYLKGG